MSMSVDYVVAKYQDDADAYSKNRILKKLMQYYYPVVRSYCLGILGREDEDLIQCGFIGLCKALNRYDRSLGKKFNTIASIYIRGEMLRYIRDCYHHVREPAYYQDKKRTEKGLTGSDVRVMCLEDASEDPVFMPDIPLSSYIKELTKGNDYYAKVLMLRYEGYGYEDIARKLRTSMHNVVYVLSKIKQRALMHKTFGF